MKYEPIIRHLCLGAFEVNTYLLACPQTKQAVLIDPAGEPEKIIDLVNTEGFKIKYILNTHGHADHVAANAEMKQHFGVPVCMHEADDRFFSDPEIRYISQKELNMAPSKPADIRLHHGDMLHVGTLEINVIHTPGHTPGSVCFYVGNNLFTGDTLFVGDAGRTDLVGGSLNDLIDSLEKYIIVLPKETIILPGHDYGDTPTSTIGREIKENPYLTDFIDVNSPPTSL